MLDIEFQSTRRIKKEKDMAQDFSSLREDELNGKVKECLKRNRYLLVMDDLWKNQVWDEGENAFLDNNQGSRILITSCLALHTIQDPAYHLRIITEEQG